MDWGRVHIIDVEYHSALSSIEIGNQISFSIFEL